MALLVRIQQRFRKRGGIQMLNQLTRNWWALAARGVLAIVWGLLAIASPGLTVALLILFFGAFALIDGAVSIYAGVAGAEKSNRWILVLQGVAGIALGLVTLAVPGITALMLVYFIAGWAIVTGILQMIAAFELRKELRGELVLFVSGLMSLLFGVLIAGFPGAGALSIVWLIGGYAVVFGITLISLALRLRARISRAGMGGMQMA
jgi:uncharacterized membrane protein HdeD (DUF308 family)